MTHPKAGRKSGAKQGLKPGPPKLASSCLVPSSTTTLTRGKAEAAADQRGHPGEHLLRGRALWAGQPKGFLPLRKHEGVSDTNNWFALQRGKRIEQIRAHRPHSSPPVSQGLQRTCSSDLTQALSLAAGVSPLD